MGIHGQVRSHRASSPGKWNGRSEELEKKKKSIGGIRMFVRRNGAYERKENMELQDKMHPRTRKATERCENLQTRLLM